MTRYFETTTTMTPGNLHEIVRGQEHRLIEIMAPVVRRQSVTLDLRQIDRIDAAGIASLISTLTTSANRRWNTPSSTDSIRSPASRSWMSESASRVM